MRTLTRTLLALLLTSGTLAIGQATPAPTPQPTTEPQLKATENTCAYRLVYSIHEVEGGKRVNTRNYTMVATDQNSTLSMKAGSRVPIPSGDGKSNEYLDVGTNILSRMKVTDGKLFLLSTIEFSGITPGTAQGERPVLRLNRAESNTTVTLGKTMLLSSIDDPVSKRVYEVEVKVTQE